MTRQALFCHCLQGEQDAPLSANMKEILLLYSCSSPFNLSDLLGINMVSFLYSFSSYAGILASSSPPRGRSHCRDSVFRTLFTIYHSHMICQTILLFALTNGGFLG